MKRGTPLARRSAPKPARKPMKQQSDKRRRYRASAEGKAGVEWMGRVKGLPCMVCGAPPPSIAHHVICGRYGTRKASDFEVISLCARHHDYPHPEAIHSGKASWEKKHGPDYGYIPVVRALLDEHEEIDF